MVRERLDERIREVHERRKAEGKTRFMGPEAVTRQDPYQSAGDTFPTFKKNPRIAEPKDAQLRIYLLSEYKAWLTRYRLAYQAWRGGSRGATFPDGTYALRVYHSVRVEPPSAPLQAA